MHRYPIQIHGLYIAPEHKVFGKRGEDVSGSDIVSLTEAKLLAGAGIEGDRFCRFRPDYDGHVTFFSMEAWDAIRQELHLSEATGPQVTRRNIVVSGVDLTGLYDVQFSIREIRFRGRGHCAPCTAMNKALGDRAREAMRSRGGLRAQIETSGRLRLGPSELLTEASFNPSAAARQSPLPRLP